MGGRPLAGQDQYRVFLKETDITDPAPTRAFVFIDEHERSINDGDTNIFNPAMPGDTEYSQRMLY